MQRLNVTALALLVLLLPAPQAEALELNRVLHGNYAVTFSRVCAQAEGGFNALLQPIGPVSQLTSTVEMVQTYNGDGTSSAVARAMNVINNASNQNELDFTCTGTYQVNSDGSFSEDMSCSGTVIAGILTGQTFTQTGIRRTGHIGAFAQTLVISGTGTNLENVTFSQLGSRTRICGRSGAAVKLR
jgi:hypothetical protein